MRAAQRQSQMRPAHGRVPRGVELGAARAAWVAVVVGVLRLAHGNGEPARGVVCEAAQAAEPQMRRSSAVSRYVNVPVVNMPLDSDASGHAPSQLRVPSHAALIYIWKVLLTDGLNPRIHRILIPDYSLTAGNHSHAHQNASKSSLLDSFKGLYKSS